jgi:4-amino-4-deoxy-L-arabinose transferase-like glycosyltransferase
MRWEQQGNPSSRWTIGFADHWFFILLLGVTAVHVYLASQLPPAEDELYYWNWAQKLQLSYYDHPPLVAVLIRISTSIFGNTLLGLRFFAVFFSFFLLYLVGHWSERKDVATLFLLTPLSFFGAILMTPDIPFLFFWALYAWWLMKIAETFSSWSGDPVTRVYRNSPVSWFRWILGGVLLGLGCLSKYTMILALPTAALILFTRYRVRAWSRGFFLHAIVALLFCVPIILFNTHHDFLPFKYQWSHAMGGSSPGYFSRFLGSQIALVGALPLLLLPWVLIRLKDVGQSPVLHVCLYFFLIPFGFSLFQAMQNYVEANWALMSYITFWPVAQWILSQTSISWLKRGLLLLGFAPALGFTALGVVHSVHPLPLVKVDKDRLGRLSSQQKLAENVAQDLRDNAIQVPVFSPNYQWTALLRYKGVQNAEQLFPEGRPSNFTLEPKDACREEKVLVFAEVSEPLQYVKCFPNREVLREYPLVVRGQQLANYVLIEYWR